MTSAFAFLDNFVLLDWLWVAACLLALFGPLAHGLWIARRKAADDFDETHSNRRRLGR